MIPTTLDDAFIAYERARRRLPQAKPRSGFKQAETLADIADDFDVFLLDAYGILNVGEVAVAGVPGRVADLQAAGKTVLIVSNASSVPHAVLMQKYDRLGYRFQAEDVITSRVTLRHELASRADILWGVMASTVSDGENFQEHRSVTLGDDPAVFDAVDGFLLVGSEQWTLGQQTLLEETLRRQPRPVLIGNPDIVAPLEHVLSDEPGLYAHRLADQTGVEPEFYGKPFGNIYDRVFDRLGPVDRSRVLMVGDTLHTDILGGQNAGTATALVTDYGFFRSGDAKAGIAASGIVPDFVLPRP